MSDGIITMAYIIASILFILALSGLSNQETARKGNYYGMAGMAIALIATIVGIVTENYLLMLMQIKNKLKCKWVIYLNYISKKNV